MKINLLVFLVLFFFINSNKTNKAETYYTMNYEYDQAIKVEGSDKEFTLVFEEDSVKDYSWELDKQDLFTPHFRFLDKEVKNINDKTVYFFKFKSRRAGSEFIHLTLKPSRIEKRVYVIILNEEKKIR